MDWVDWLFGWVYVMDWVDWLFGWGLCGGFTPIGYLVEELLQERC
nr:hypothetical protein [uncultured Methanobacterium sp.]